MARALIAAVTPSAAGVNPAPTAANSTDDMYFPWARGRLLVVRNADDDTAVNVTIPTPATPGGLALADQGPASVAFGTVKVFGPFPAALYRQTDGNVHVDLDVATGITLGTLDVPSVD